MEDSVSMEFEGGVAGHLAGLELSDVVVFRTPNHCREEVVRHIHDTITRTLGDKMGDRPLIILHSGMSLQSLSDEGDDRSLWQLGLKRIERLREYLDERIQKERAKIERLRPPETYVAERTEATITIEALQQVRISMLGERLG